MIHIEKDNVPRQLRDTHIYLYGGGYTGKVIINLFNHLDLKIEGIIDDDEGLQGEKVEDIEVISFRNFVERNQIMSSISIVLTSIYGKAILKKLRDLPQLKIYELFDWYSEIIGNKEWINQITNERDLQELRSGWELIKSNLTDEKSVEVLSGLSKYFDTKDLNDIAEICTDEEQYFIPEVLSAIKQPLSIIDAGAYRGELLHSILHNNLELEKWYCFEPDQENFALLTEQAEKNNLGNKQICIKKGLWNNSGKLYFKSGDATGSRIVPYETPDFVEVVSIDEFINENKCNFIKMDIEGAELPALKGAIHVIKRERPILAICIYHSLKDYWEIPKFLISELENYKYYVRHHALICNETVLYAIPK